VPCYNEEENIALFMSEIEKTTIPYETEVIFVDDGSSDGTTREIKKTNAKYISFSRNFGKEAAILAGLEKASGSLVAIMDVDLQDPPSLIPQMLNMLESDDVDCVATYRKDRKGEKIIRSFFSNMFYRVINRISDVEIKRGARDFRIMKRNMVEAILGLKEVGRFSKGIFAWVGFKTQWIAYENTPRERGETKFSFGKLTRYAISGIISFTSRPLRIAVKVGLWFIIISILLMIALIIRQAITGASAYGWTSLVCLILGTTGVNIFFLGVIGHYLSEMFYEVKNRPKYIIREENIDS